MIVESDDVLSRRRPYLGAKTDWVTGTSTTHGATTSTGEQFAGIDGLRGIARDDTPVVGSWRQEHWWAAYALWVFTLFGHADVRLNGGRDLLARAPGNHLGRPD